MADHLREPLGLVHFQGAAWLPGGRRGEAARQWWRALAEMVEALAERYPRQLAAFPTTGGARRIWPSNSGRLRRGAASLTRATSPCSPKSNSEYHEKLDRIRELLDERAEAILLQTRSKR
jgi:hypothetical protein